MLAGVVLIAVGLLTASLVAMTQGAPGALVKLATALKTPVLCRGLAGVLCAVHNRDCAQVWRWKCHFLCAHRPIDFRGND